MLKSRKSQSFSSLTQSINQSKVHIPEIGKKYRCECCNDTKYHDYNRENRIKRQEVMKKRGSISHRYDSQQNDMNLTNLTERIQISKHSQYKKSSSLKKLLPSIQESVEKKQVNPSLISQQSPISPFINMKQFCNKLFTNQKGKNRKHRIQINLNNQLYEICFQNKEKLKFVMGELKNIIRQSEKAIK